MLVAADHHEIVTAFDAASGASLKSHAEQYDDAGEQLREARQVRIIARVLDGHTESPRE